MKKRIAIIGSTGSIGRQALAVVDTHRDRFIVEVLTAHTRADLLIEQALVYRPRAVVIVDDKYYRKVKDTLTPVGIEVHAGVQALASIVHMDTIDMVLMALVGYAGVLPTINSINANKNIALANKEVLVVAGELITRLAKEKQVNVYPIDSEHSAIFQCLVGEGGNPIEKIILTASGGPFLGKGSQELENVTVAEALQHPNWVMGDKVTIDSATLMNKGLEVIEAKWLFDLMPHQIEVIIHPQSIIHSMVQFRDGSIKAQLGVPDMRLPIQFAMSYPERLENNFERFDFNSHPSFIFTKPDTKNFRNLVLAFEALNRGGNMPCVLNAANEVAVLAFLEGRISFLNMPQIVEQCMEKADFLACPGYEDYVITDRETRTKALEVVRSIAK